MYPSSEITKVPGGYIVESKIEGDDGDIYLETIVFTSAEGVIKYLQSYFSDWSEPNTSDGGGDRESHVLFTRE